MATMSRGVVVVSLWWFWRAYWTAFPKSVEFWSGSRMTFVSLRPEEGDS